MLYMALGESLTAISLLHAQTDTLRVITAAVRVSEAVVCLALLVERNWALEIF